MAFHYLSGYPNTLIEDPFVVGLDGEYLFNGATLRDGWFVPNSIEWDICLSLGINRNIGFSRETVALLVDGQVRAQTKHFLGGAVSFHHPLPREYAKELLYPSRSYPLRTDLSHFWSLVKGQLTKASDFDENATKILSAITDWERSSKQTLQWLLSKTKKPDQPNEGIEIIVSDTCWLLRDRVENRLVVGEFENIWGEVHIPKGEEIIRLAAPVKNGWFIEAPSGDKYLLLWNGNSIDLQDVCFPYGKWTRHGNWTFWTNAHVLLTPAGRIFAVPSNTRALGASSRWFFFSAFPDLVIVDQEGKTYKEEIPKQLGRRPWFFIGDNSVFIVRRGNKYYHFSVANASDWPFRHRLWESVAFPQDAECQVGVIRGNPDIFIAILKISSKKMFGICLIDGQGRIGRNPPFFKWNTSHWPTFGLKNLGNNQAVVEVKLFEKQEEIKIEVVEDQVQIDLGDGVTLISKMVPFSATGKKTLLEILNDAYPFHNLLQNKGNK